MQLKYRLILDRVFRVGDWRSAPKHNGIRTKMYGATGEGLPYNPQFV